MVKDKKVHVENLRPEMKDGLRGIADIWKEEGLAAPVITSGNDGIHPDKRKEGLDCSTEAKCRATSGSRHYQDLAVDVRSNDLLDKEKQKTLDDLKTVLQDKGYYVKLEYPGQAKEHFHIQYNPPTSRISTERSNR